VKHVKNIRSKRRVIGVAVIIAIVVVPLLYSYLYLGAFWDPYSRLNTLPVAVVNKDQGADVNGTKRNFGAEMCEYLKEDGTLKFVFTEEEDAKSGTEGKDYYAMIVIPENFSENITSASKVDKQTATITYSPNEKRNYLASQILSRAVLEIEESVRAKVDKEIVQELADNIKAVPNQMLQLQNGFDKLGEGTLQLQEGTNTLAEGTTSFRDKFTEYSEGIASVKAGSEQLVIGTTSLDSGLGELQAGADKLVTATSKVEQLSAGAQRLVVGMETFNDGLIQYTTGVDTLISSVNSTSAFLKQYVTTVNPSIMKDPVFAAFITKLSDPSNVQSIGTLQAGSEQLKDTSAQIAAGASELSKGNENLPQLKAALVTLSEGLAKAKEGSAKLSIGSDSLNLGLATIKGATLLLSDATKDIATGAAALNSGAKELNTGIETAKAGVDTAITDTKEQLVTLEGLAEFAEAPVNVQQSNVTSIPNYGTAFAPYFLSLSLWVGALIMFVGIYLDTEGKFKILSRNSDNKIARSFIYLLIGFAQAIALAVALKYGLGLKVDNLLLYYASCCLVSMVFISIVQFLMVHLKDVGKLLSIILLILQLTSCGGTFPMETVPKLFNVLYPFMPMTYSVGLFKQAISEVDQSEVLFNVGVLGAILIVFMGLTIALSVLKTKRAGKTDAQTVTDLIAE
jgi:putative membrane protein